MGPRQPGRWLPDSRSSNAALRPRIQGLIVSIKAMSTVWDVFPNGGTDLLTLLALADWSDDSGRCYPSIGAIAKKTRLSTSQARRVVHALIEDGFVSVLGNEYGGAPGATRQYQINLDRLTAGADAPPTTSASATPTASTDARGTASAHARDGWRGCAETASAHASQTVSEPSVNHQVVAQALSASPKKAKVKRQEITFSAWLEQVKQVGEKPISDYEPLLTYIERSGLPSDLVNLSWAEFKRRYLPGGTSAQKRYADWRRVFLKAIEGNWFNIWRHNGSEYCLTTQGQQAQRVNEFREAA